MTGLSDFSLEINPSSTVSTERNLPVYETYPCSKPYERALRVDSFTDSSLQLHELDPSAPLPAFLTISDLDGKFSIIATDPSLTG